MSACDELVGRPKYQVIRFQAIAPIRPHKITPWVTFSTCSMPLPMVEATAVPKKKAAMKLKNAAQITAYFGESTRVDTTVAMELAASWKPLMKSKVSAAMTISETNSKVGLTAGPAR